MPSYFMCFLFYGFILHIWSLDADQRGVDKGKEKHLGKCNDTLTKLTGNYYLSNFTDCSVCYYSIQPNASLTNSTVAIKLFLENIILHKDDVLAIYRNKTDAEVNENPLISNISAQNGSVTIVTDEKSLVLKLTGTDRAYMRHFDGYYDATNCHFNFHDDIDVVNSPIATNIASGQVDCLYTYSKDVHHRTIPSFSFEQYNFSSFPIAFSSENFKDPFMDFIPENNSKSFSFTVKFKVPTNETFRFRVNKVDSMCSFYVRIQDQPYTLESPDFTELNNGSVINECRWIFEDVSNERNLSIQFDELIFDSVQDIISVNDGGSEFSAPLTQISTSSQNTSNKIVLSSTNRMWVAFKPISYHSKVKATIHVHKEGGHYKGNGIITLNSTVSAETVYQLEVEPNKLVFLNFTSAVILSPASLRIYNGFDKTDLLATVQNQIWYPLLSQSNKMMIIATEFDKSSFAAQFKGVAPGCMQMSSLSSQDYVLSGNCNSSCIWIIPPQNVKNSVLLLDMQFLSLEKEDEITIAKLDSGKTVMGTVASTTNHVPSIVIPANVGAMVEVTRGSCKKAEDVVLVGHSSYVPTCDKDLNFINGTFQISSPLYPDTYPLFQKCRWNITTPEQSYIHLTFQTLNLAEGHCLRFIGPFIGNVTYGPTEVLPADLLSNKGPLMLEFDSANCDGSQLRNLLVSSEGFLLNGTVTDCGGIMNTKKGEFNISNKQLCIWKIEVPPGSTKGSVNIVSYTVNKKDDKENYELTVYDGASVRDSAITNHSNSEIWGKTNTLIFVYKKIDLSKTSASITVKFDSIGCNQTMQCDNKMCLHPDWRCNGINECGDFTDERYCAGVPVIPQNKIYGYSDATFWTTIFVMLCLGMALGIVFPIVKEKVQNSRRYDRFDDISDIN